MLNACSKEGMLRGAPLPLLPLPVGAVGGKRPRLDDFNPVEDPEDALQQYGSVRDELGPTERMSAITLFTDFLSDVAADKTVIYDIETTELVDRAPSSWSLLSRILRSATRWLTPEKTFSPSSMKIIDGCRAMASAKIGCGARRAARGARSTKAIGAAGSLRAGTGRSSSGWCMSTGVCALQRGTL